MFRDLFDFIYSENEVRNPGDNSLNYSPRRVTSNNVAIHLRGFLLHSFLLVTKGFRINPLSIFVIASFSEKRYVIYHNASE